MLRDEDTKREATWCGVEKGSEQRCEQLHRSLKRIVKARGVLDAQEAEALREAQALHLWRYYGYSSLIEYMEFELGYSPRAALERLRVAKAIEELPVIAEKLTQGDLSFSAARELTRVATPETEGEWIEAANDKNLREVDDLVSGRKRGDKPTDPADPKLRKRVLRYEVKPETVALVRQAQQILEQERGERLDDDAFINALCRQVLDTPKNTRTRAAYQIATITCRDCKRGWQQGGGLSVEMSPPTLERALCDGEYIGAVDDITYGDGDGDDDGQADPSDSGSDDATATRASTTPSSADNKTGHGDKTGRGSKTDRAKKPRARQAIPPALRRKVLARDGYKCRVPGCRSARNIDCHHIVMVSEGGKNVESNLLSTCEGHHLDTHDGSLIIGGDAFDPTFTRRANNAFTTMERVVDTKAALRTLGFKLQEVKEAIDKARTHVGTTPLSLEQWIAVALRYCPRPVG